MRRTIILALACLALSACATTGGGKGLPFGPGQTGDEDARIAAELLAWGAMKSGPAAVDAGVLRGEKRAQVRGLFEPGVKVLDALRAADEAANAPQLAAQATAAAFIFLEVRQLVAAGAPPAPAAGEDPAPSALAAIAGLGALAPEAAALAAEARTAFAARDEAVKRAFIQRLTAMNNALVGETRARIRAQPIG